MKKFISFVTSLTVAASAVAPALTSAASEFYGYADYLAGKSVIKKTDEAGYRLGDKITRAEMAKVAANLAGLELKPVDGKVFGDVTDKLGDLAQYIEAMAAAGYVAKNPTFRPMDLISRAEMVKMLLKAKGVMPTDEDQGFTDIAKMGDLMGYINAAAKSGIISKNMFFRPTDTASRGEVFKVAAKADGYVETDDLGLGDLFGTGTTSSGTTSTGVIVTPAAGDLAVALNPASPAAATIPGAISLKIASFDFKAASSDISVKSLTLLKQGLGSNNVFKDIILTSKDGRISSKGNFDSTTDKVEITLTNPLVIKAGSVETISVVGTVGTVLIGSNGGLISSGDKIGVALVGVSSTAKTVSALNIASAVMTVGAVNAAIVKVEADIAPSNVTLGDLNVDIARFKITNTNSDNNATVSSITLRDNENKLADLRNIALYADGTKVADGVVSGKFVTFSFSPVTLKSSNGVSYFKIKADVATGAGDAVNLYLDKSTDVQGTDLKYGYGVAVSNLFDTTYSAKVTIQAGRLTVVKVNPTTTDIQQDKTDVILGSFQIVNKGNAVRLETLKVTATEVGSGVVRNSKVKLRFNGVTKELTLATAPTYSSDDIDTVIPTGTTSFDVVADTNALITAGATIQLAIDFAANATIKDVQDDKLVTDVTPSTISFSKLTVKAATATVSALPIAKTNAVVGSSNVVVLKASVEAGTMSNVTVSRVVLQGPANFSKTVYSAIRLYKDSVADANLIKSISPSDINATTKQVAIDFPTNLAIAKNGSVTLIATVDLIDDQANVSATEFKFGIPADGVSLYDGDNKLITGIASVTSVNGLVIKGLGTLALSEDTDSKYTSAKNIVAGAESDVLGGWKFTATNEGIKLKKLTVSATGLLNSVSKVTLLKADKTTVIASKDVSSDTVTFDNEYIINEGNDTIYVKLTTLPYGKNQAGSVLTNKALTLTVVDAEGASSSKDVVAAMSSSSKALTGNFSVIPTRLSAVQFVNTATVGNTTATVDTSLSTGLNTIAILMVSADKFTSTDPVTGDELKAQLEKLNLNVTNLSGNVVIERVGGSGTGTVTGSGANFDAATLAQLGVNAQLKSSEVAYFAIKATPASTNTNDSMQASVSDLNTAMAYGSYSTSYSTPVDVAATGFVANLGTTSMTAAKVVAK